jgi:hypothetical protein
MPKSKKDKNSSDHYIFHLLIILVVAIVATFLIPLGSSKFLDSNAPERSQTFQSITLTPNYDFHVTRTGSSYAPEGWYLSDTYEEFVKTFPFLRSADITPWDSTLMHVAEDGLFINNAGETTYIFTPTFRTSDLNLKSNNIQMRATLSYTIKGSFSCCGTIRIPFSSDGKTEAGSLALNIDGRNPGQETCTDDMSVWAPCKVSTDISPDNRVTTVVDFYPSVKSMKYFGMMFYPNSVVMDDVTINQLKLEVMPLPPGQSK